MISGMRIYISGLFLLPTFSLLALNAEDTPIRVCHIALYPPELT